MDANSVSLQHESMVMVSSYNPSMSGLERAPLISNNRDAHAFVRLCAAFKFDRVCLSPSFDQIVSCLKSGHFGRGFKCFYCKVIATTASSLYKHLRNSCTKFPDSLPRSLLVQLSIALNSQLWCQNSFLMILSRCPSSKTLAWMDKDGFIFKNTEEEFSNIFPETNQRKAMYRNIIRRSAKKDHINFLNQLSQYFLANKGIRLNCNNGCFLCMVHLEPPSDDSRQKAFDHMKLNAVRLAKPPELDQGITQKIKGLIFIVILDFVSKKSINIGPIQDLQKITGKVNGLKGNDEKYLDSADEGLCFSESGSESSESEPESQSTPRVDNMNDSGERNIRVDYSQGENAFVAHSQNLIQTKGFLFPNMTADIRHYFETIPLVKNVIGYFEESRKLDVDPDDLLRGEIAPVYHRCVTTLLQFLFATVTLDRPKSTLRKINLGDLLSEHHNINTFLKCTYSSTLQLATIYNKNNDIISIIEVLDKFVDSIASEKLKRVSKFLQRYEHCKKVRRLGEADIKLRKSKFCLKALGKFLTEQELRELGHHCLRKANECRNSIEAGEKSSQNAYSYQIWFILSLCTLGPCYRSHEFYKMLDSNVKYQDGIRIYIALTKNTVKKGKGSRMYFDPFWYRHFVFFRTVVRPILNSLDSSYLFLSTDGSPIKKATFSKDIVKHIKTLRSSFNGGMRSLRFLQSAHIMERYRAGIISRENMDEHCKVFDRSFEVWEKCYSFTDTLLDRQGKSNIFRELLGEIPYDLKTENIIYLGSTLMIPHCAQQLVAKIIDDHELRLLTRNQNQLNVPTQPCDTRIPLSKIPALSEETFILNEEQITSLLSNPKSNFWFRVDPSKELYRWAPKMFLSDTNMDSICQLLNRACLRRGSKMLFISTYRVSLIELAQKWTHSLEPYRLPFLDASYTFCFIIHQRDHWQLLTVQPSVDRIYSYCSLGGAVNHDSVQSSLDILRGILRIPVNNSLITDYHRSPRQANGYDCGVFVLMRCIYIATGMRVKFVQGQAETARNILRELEETENDPLMKIGLFNE